MEDDSITNSPDENEGTPAYLHGHKDVGAMRAHHAATASPIELAMAARISAKKHPHPDPAKVAQQQMRAVPAPPVDLLSLTNAKDYDCSWAAPKLQAIHQCWADLKEVALDRDNTVERLHQIGEREVTGIRKKLEEAKTEIIERLSTNHKEARQVVLARVDPQLASDIRRAFAEKAKKDGVGAVQELLRSEVVASAVLSSPGLVFGFTEEKMDEYYELAFARHAPQLHARRASLRRVLRQIEQAQGYVSNTLEPAVKRWAPRAASPAMKRLTPAS